MSTFRAGLPIVARGTDQSHGFVIPFAPTWFPRQLWRIEAGARADLNCLDKLKQIQPEMKVLYMSGYVGDKLHDYGPLEVLEKPFAKNALLGRVRLLWTTSRNVRAFIGLLPSCFRRWNWIPHRR